MKTALVLLLAAFPLAIADSLESGEIFKNNLGRSVHVPKNFDSHDSSEDLRQVPGQAPQPLPIAPELMQNQGQPITDFEGDPIPEPVQPQPMSQPMPLPAPQPLPQQVPEALPTPAVEPMPWPMIQPAIPQEALQPMPHPVPQPMPQPMIMPNQMTNRADESMMEPSSEMQITPVVVNVPSEPVASIARPDMETRPDNNGFRPDRPGHGGPRPTRPTTTTPRPTRPTTTSWRPSEPTSCRQLRCPSNMFCIMERPRNCRRFPCNPEPVCIRAQVPTNPGPSSCSQIRCSPGLQCQMVVQQCGFSTCPLVPACVAPATTPAPLPTCDNVRCSTGLVCMMNTLPCSRAPCPTVPQCVDPCITMRCGPGTVCTKDQWTGQAQCVASGHFDPCSVVDCRSGTCRVVNGRAECQQTAGPDPVPASCAAISCAVGTTCQVINGIPQCSLPSPSSCRVPFEERRQCASHCEPTCGNRAPVGRICSTSCAPARCQCRQGFYRDPSGACVTANECDIQASPSGPATCASTTCPPGQDCYDGGATGAVCSPPCARNEKFATCSSMCEAKCGQYGPIACILMCGPPKCQCDQGFYRHPHSQECPAISAEASEEVTDDNLPVIILISP